MRLRGLLVLAILAALLGAPSIASGAGNTLSSPQVSPGTGTIDTVFTLRVRYEGRLAATSVTATVGGKLLTMTLVAGTPESGTWSASATLPAGRWAPLFAATDYRGGLATLVGSPVSVTESAPPATTPQPSVITSPKPSDSTDEGVVPNDPDGPGTDDDPPGGDAPDAAPAPAPAEDDGPDPSADAAPAPPPGPTDSSTGDADGTPGTDPPAASRTGDGVMSSSSSPAAERDDDDEPLAGPQAASGRPRSLPTSKADADDTTAPNGEELPAQDDLLGVALLIGLAGVAAVALAGTMILVIARQRGDSEDDTEGLRAAAAATDALLERRTVARAHVRLDEDPIVKALGIDEAEVRRSRGRRR